MRTGVPLARETLVESATLPEQLYLALDETFKRQIKIEKVDNTRDMDKPISTAVAAALALKQDINGGPINITVYRHTQAAALNIWVIPHNLNHRPLVNIYTSGWVEMIAQVVHLDDNNTQVLFDTAQSGYAILL